MRLHDSTPIAAALDRVWGLTIDVESWPETTPTMTSVERLDPGPLAPGSRARVRQPGQRTRTWTVESIEPEERFTWATRAFGCRLVATHALTADETGTTNTLVLDLEGPMAGLVGRLLGRPLRRALVQENAGFRTAAEGRTEAPHPAP